MFRVQPAYFLSDCSCGLFLVLMRHMLHSVGLSQKAEMRKTLFCLSNNVILDINEAKPQHLPFSWVPLTHSSKGETPGHREFRPPFLFYTVYFIYSASKSNPPPISIKQAYLVFGSTFYRYTLYNSKIWVYVYSRCKCKGFITGSRLRP